MQPIDAAIMRTLLYADLFDFAMTDDEIHRFLIHVAPIPREKIQHALRTHTALSPLIIRRDGYTAVRDNPAAIDTRIQREQMTLALWGDAQRYGRLFARIPFVRMVALTGALAVRNPASYDDDFDYLLVTEPGRVWISRLFAVMIVRLVRLRGRELCPNYVMATDQLIQRRQDLYTAHELAQMIPVSGTDIYHAMLNANRWMSAYLPNANPTTPQHTTNKRGLFTRLLEFVFSGKIGNVLESWEYRRKQRKFREQMQPQNSAVIDASQVKGHFNDHGYPVLRRYHSRLIEYGLETDFLPAAVNSA